MSNTVFGPYSKTAWSDGVTALNQTHLNNLENSAQTAINSLNADFSGAFVHSGITCARNGVTLNQLDVASGIAYLAFSDGTVGKIAVGPSSAGQFTTSVINTTYYLFLKNDGTWQWSTTSTAANAIPIAQATTDGSGNINVVTDVRQNAGSPGIPYMVAKQLRTNVTATTDQILATVTATAPGMYQFNLYFTYRNATPQKVTAFARWKDKDLGVAATGYFMLASPGSNSGQVLNGSQASTTGNNQGCACYAITAYAETGDFLSVHFQDPGGTPNDMVSVTISRIG